MNAVVQISKSVPDHMNSSIAFDLLNEIAATSSKNTKQELVGAALKSNTMFRHLVTMTLDPFVSFGIKKLPKIPEGGQNLIGRAALTLLEDLKARRLTGNAAKDAIVARLSVLEPKSRELMVRVLTKNLKAGFSESTVNKAAPGTIYTFKVQLSEKLAEYADWVDSQISTDNPWWAELKEDGVRGVAHADRNSTGEFFSREGKPLNASDELRAEVVELQKLMAERIGKTCVLDGEISSIKGIFNDVVGDVHKKSVGDTMMLKWIDWLTCEEFEAKAGTMIYIERRKIMEEVMAEHGGRFPRIKLIQRWPVTSVREANDLAEKLIANKEEGIILKKPDGLWRAKRTTDWLKVKDINTIDLVVKRLEYGEAGKQFEHIMGAAICDMVTPQGTTIEVSIGGGWSIQQRTDYMADPSLIVGHLIEVEFHEYTKDGSLRHPRFKRDRTGDKPATDGQGC